MIEQSGASQKVNDAREAAFIEHTLLETDSWDRFRQSQFREGLDRLKSDHSLTDAEFITLYRGPFQERNDLAYGDVVRLSSKDREEDTLFLKALKSLRFLQVNENITSEEICTIFKIPGFCRFSAHIKLNSFLSLGLSSDESAESLDFSSALKGLRQLRGDFKLSNEELLTVFKDGANPESGEARAVRGDLIFRSLITLGESEKSQNNPLIAALHRLRE